MLILTSNMRGGEGRGGGANKSKGLLNVRTERFVVCGFFHETNWEDRSKAFLWERKKTVSLS